MIQGDEKGMSRGGLGLVEALALGPGPGLVSVVGGGGPNAAFAAVLAATLGGASKKALSAAAFASLHPAGGGTNTCCSFLQCPPCSFSQSFFWHFLSQ